MGRRGRRPRLRRRTGPLDRVHRRPAPGDSRALVHDLGATLKNRVELRQLSPCEEARVQGGIGSCGRDLCCATFLKNFEPVSLRMARDQDLPLNPMRISGACGRRCSCSKASVCGSRAAYAASTAADGPIGGGLP